MSNQNFESLSQLNWQSIDNNSDFAQDLIPEPLKSWLANKGSLTQVLRSIPDKRFSVRVLLSKWTELSSNEQNHLQINDHKALIREVFLQLNDQPIVFARTVFPSKTLVDENEGLLELGNSSLGDFLFQQQSIVRNEIKISRVMAKQLTGYVDQIDTENRKTWARRSVFFLNNKPLMVYEFFLPSLFDMGVID